MEGCIESRKRVRVNSDDSLSNVFGSKLVRVDSTDLGFISPDASDAKLIGSEQIGIYTDDSVLNSFEVNAIEEDLLKILDEADASMDRDSAIQGLDSVIRSFEKEIQVPAIEVASESGESQAELGYLLEASDDDLGIPPSARPGDKVTIEAIDFVTHSSSMKGFSGGEDEIRSDCWLDCWGYENGYYNENGEEVVALGGLFEHTDVAVEFPHRSETTFCL